MILSAIQPESGGALGVVLFYVLAVLASASAVYVMLSRNIVRMAVGLLFTLTAVAGLYFLLDAEFLAAVQLVIYVGGTLILIVFGVMLTSKGPFARYEPRRGEVLLAGAIAVIMLAALVLAIATGARKYFAAQEYPAHDEYPITALGQALLGDYLVPFELVSVILLVVMIGAAYLAKARRRSP